MVSARHVLLKVSRCRPADDDGRIQLIGADYVGHQPMTLEGGHASSRLVATGLYQQMSVRGKPVHRVCGDSPMHVKPVRTAVERDQGS